MLVQYDAREALLPAEALKGHPATLRILVEEEPVVDDRSARRNRMRLLLLAVGTTVGGALYTLLWASFAGIYVPTCRDGFSWSAPGPCGSVYRHVVAAEGVTSIGAALLVTWAFLTLSSYRTRRKRAKEASDG